MCVRVWESDCRSFVRSLAPRRQRQRRAREAGNTTRAVEAENGAEARHMHQRIPLLSPSSLAPRLPLLPPPLLPSFRFAFSQTREERGKAAAAAVAG